METPTQPVTMSGTNFQELTAPLAHLKDSEYDSHLNKVIRQLKAVTLPETDFTSVVTGDDSPPVPPTPAWQKFVSHRLEQTQGQHIMSHGSAELGDPLIVNAIQAHSNNLEQLLTSAFAIPSVTDPHQIISEGVLYKLPGYNCSYNHFVGDIGTYRKSALTGYEKPFNLRFILTIPNLSVKTRKVIVHPDDMRLVTRHGTDLAFMMVPGANIINTQYLNTIVLTYWVYPPLPDTSNPVKWTFGTSYVSDTFPRSNPSLLDRLSDIIKNPDSHNQEQLVSLINTSQPMYALV